MPEQQAETPSFAQAWAEAREVRPKVVVKADLVPAISVLSMVGLLGIPLGWIWSRLAPTQRMRVVSAEGDPIALQLESWHRFDALAIFALMGLATGLVVGVAVWFLRERRGPVVLLAAVGGSLLAAWLGMRMGIAFADSLHAVTGTPNVGDIVEKAPVLESGWVVIAQPLTVALAYGVLATWNSRDDLGRRLG
ncbi:Protein of unknown function [Prauserella marina]|uniref:Uncharacterized protein n=1 Tax=Prauserella marina TaxID=530584 RepID=A0A1G6MMI2_9PSEU|nr:DUF2567 domain-containing protein [Prauserella marina]PWV85355.1 uncharacterized protein DUF2567 [Prauserella marina]SDC56778.1 Protein of unknown function [Prauserella marina]